METIDLWTESLMAAATTLWSTVAAFLPSLFAALLILGFGYFFARIVSRLLEKLLKRLGVDGYSENTGLVGALERAGVNVSVSHIVSRVVFWILMLTFVVSVTETLGLPRVSATIDSLVQYLPKILGAVFILLAGLLIAGFVRDAIRTGAEGIGLEYASGLGSAAYVMLSVIVIALAIGQLDLETAILTQAISIILISAGAAAALAFGLGSREVAANVLSGSYIRDQFQPGSRIEVDGYHGTIESIGAINVVVRRDDGDLVSIPNRQLTSSVVIEKG